MKASPSQFVRPDRPTFDIEFVGNKGQASEYKFTVQLRQFTRLAQMDAVALGNQTALKYQPPLYLMNAEGEPIPVPYEAAIVAAQLFRAQSIQDDDERYTVKDFLLFMQDDGLVAQFFKAVWSLSAPDAAPAEDGDSEAPKA